MSSFFGNAFNDLMKAVDDFANCTSTIPERRKEEPAKPNYVYSSDNYIDAPLNNFATKAILKGIATKYYGQQVEDIVCCENKLTSESFPRLWDNFVHCCKTLGITDYPDTYVTGRLMGINGLSVEVNDRKLILLSYQTSVLLDDAEQRFLIGHELGHIQQDHLFAHTVQGLLSDLNKKSELLAPIVNDMLEVPLNRWYRESEFTADRAGLLCCGDINAAVLLLSKVREKRYFTAYVNVLEMFERHPLIETRISKLKDFYTQKI